MSEENPKPQGPVVSELRSITEQVGAHVLQCLRKEETVAVISTVVPGVGPGSDRVVSMPLNAQKMAEIDLLLQGIREMAEAEFEEKCIGFQCAIPAEQKD
jgi:hypothetical protein